MPELFFAPVPSSYVNEACGELCSTRHPTRHYYRCSETDRWWVDCSECGSIRVHPGAAAMIGGRWYCDPPRHDFILCNECEEWYPDGDCCSTCCRECNPTEDWDDEYDEEICPAPRRGACSECSTRADHFDLVSEQYLCDHRMRLLLADRPFHPVKLTRELVNS